MASLHAVTSDALVLKRVRPIFCNGIAIVGGPRAHVSPLYACNRAVKRMLYICKIVIITKKMPGSGSGLVGSRARRYRREGKGRKQRVENLPALFAFNETQVDLRRARTCTPEDAPFTITLRVDWIVSTCLVRGWG